MTLTFDPERLEIRVGIHWRSGASDELKCSGLSPPAPRAPRPNPAPLAVPHRHAARQHLNQTGHLTASDRPFNEDGVRWLRWKHRIASPSPLAWCSFLGPTSEEPQRGDAREEEVSAAAHGHEAGDAAYGPTDRPCLDRRSPGRLVVAYDGVLVGV